MRTSTGLPINGMFVVVLIMLYVTSFPVYASLPDTAGISFVSMSATSNPQGGSAVVNYDYFISTYEATVGQWNTFKADIGVPVTGSPAHAYDSEPAWSDQDMPVTNVSWYEAAQFVNWLNTSNGFAPAYNFTGTQGTSVYTFSTWSLSQSMNGNLFRNKNAQYFLPTESEWMKAAYYNGDQLQLYATPDDALPVAGSCANYGYELSQPWAVGTGSVEVNGTYDMMGNVFEWIEDTFNDPYFGPDSVRKMRGGAFDSYDEATMAGDSSYFYGPAPGFESPNLGFRVVAVVHTPEPAIILAFLAGATCMLSHPTRRLRG